MRGYWLWLFFVLLLAARAKSINLVDYFRLRRDVRVRAGGSGRFFLRYRCCARWIVFGGIRWVGEGYEKRGLVEEDGEGVVLGFGEHAGECGEDGDGDLDDHAPGFGW